MKHMLKATCLIALSAIIGLFGVERAFAAEPYIFPVIGNANYSNDYDAPRSNGPHHAIDIIASKGSLIVSAVNGIVDYVNYPEPSWGNAVRIKGDDNYCYWYIHMNNDNPGTDDGKGGAMQAYAPDMNAGNRVVRGQFVGWVGDSGNAENTVSHLHFSVHPLTSQGRCSEDQAVNPYWNLLNSTRIGAPVNYPHLQREELPFPGYRGGMNVAFGDLTDDGVKESIVAGGKGGESRVNIYNGDGLMKTFYAFPPSETIGMGTDVAVGDVDDDGVEDLITSGYTKSGGSRIAVYKYSPEGTVIKMQEFNVFGSHYGVARVASGDIDGDGMDEIIAGANVGGGPRVSAINVDGTVQKTQYAYDSAFTGGVDVAAGDVSGDSRDEVVVAPLSGGNSLIRVLNVNLDMMYQFYSYTYAYVGGVNVSVGNVQTSSAKSEIATVASPGFPQMYYYNYSGTQLSSKYVIERWWVGYYDVAIMENAYNVTTGVNRRAAVRW